MSEESRTFTNAKITAQLMINRFAEKTDAIIRAAVAKTCQLSDYASVDMEKLVDMLQRENNLVYDDLESILECKEHNPWLYPSGKPIQDSRKIRWKFWEDYRQNLLYKGWPQKVIDSIDEMSTKILMRLEDPQRTGLWWRRGLVVGDVQSGKTANYTGLICKAADAGYRLIVIFAGLHNSLRGQTQQRLDFDFIGFDSDKDERLREESNRIGVGMFHRHPVVHYATTSNEHGDFSRTHANKTGLSPAGRDPAILIVKKNASIIRNLTNWALRMGREEGRQKIRGIPSLGH